LRKQLTRECIRPNWVNLARQRWCYALTLTPHELSIEERAANVDAIGSRPTVTPTSAPGHKPTHAAQQAHHGLQACIMATRRRSEPFHAWQPTHKTTIAVRELAPCAPGARPGRKRS